MKKVLLVLVAMVAFTFSTNAQKITKNNIIFDNYQGILTSTTVYDGEEITDKYIIYLRQDKRYTSIVSYESFFYGKTIEEFKEHMAALEKFSLEHSRETSSEISEYPVTIYKPGEVIVWGKNSSRAYTLLKQNDFKKIKKVLFKAGL